VATLRASLRRLSLTDRVRFGVDVGALLLLSGAAVGALEFRRLARYFPFWVSVFFAILALANVVHDVRSAKSGTGIIKGDAIDSASMSTYDGASPIEALKATTLYMGWVVGYVALIYVIGMPIATVIFLTLWLRRIAEAQWVHIVISVAVMLGMLFGVTEALGFRWPHSLIEIWR
jgi:hypothetical protein